MGFAGPTPAPASAGPPARAGTGDPDLAAAARLPVLRLNPQLVQMTVPASSSVWQDGQRRAPTSRAPLRADCLASSASAYKASSRSSAGGGAATCLGTTITLPHLHLTFLPASSGF